MKRRNEWVSSEKQKRQKKKTQKQVKLLLASVVIFMAVGDIVEGELLHSIHNKQN